MISYYQGVVKQLFDTDSKDSFSFEFFSLTLGIKSRNNGYCGSEKRIEITKSVKLNEEIWFTKHQNKWHVNVSCLKWRLFICKKCHRLKTKTLKMLYGGKKNISKCLTFCVLCLYVALFSFEGFASSYIFT